MQLQKPTEHAFRCLAFLARMQRVAPNEFYTKKDISMGTGLTGYYIQRILLPLRDALFIEAKRSSTGGFRLAMPPDQISLLDVIRVTENSSRLVPELDESDEGGLCELPGQDVWDRLQTVLDEKLQSATIADLL